MVIAYHAIFATYGFWLPNDPRGSWSEWIGAWELLRFGEATGGKGIRRSVAHAEHDIELRLAAKRALKYPEVVFNGLQARAVGTGFAEACDKSGYEILACSILPQHVHLVIKRHAQDIERMVGHLKGRATRQLREENLHPLAAFQNPADETLTVWGENCWKVFLNTDVDVWRAIKYVQNNPLKEGKPPQVWAFVQNFGRIV